jgi:hypothetical protein
LATASCDLWQNEHLKVSSDPDLVFTCHLFSVPAGTTPACRIHLFQSAIHLPA